MSRADRVLAGLAAREVDAMLLTADHSLRWVGGYTGDNGIALLGPSVRTLITDGRYATSARAEVSGLDVVIGERDLMDSVAEALAGLPEGTRVGVEADEVTLARFARLEAIAGPVRLVPVRGVVEDLRVTKDEDEVGRIAEAAAIADRALARVLADGVVGRREVEVASALVSAMVDEGAEGPSFDPIVAAGPNGALPHAIPTREPIPADTLLTIDMGARYRGYCSDMTRTFATGTPPAELLEAYGATMRAQRLACQAVRPGITGRELDEVARASLAGEGLGERFVHGLGHGVGLQIHERPGIRRTAEETLVAGMVITIEPGVYLEGVGGVRIEDLVLVTEDGGRVLNAFPHGEGDAPPQAAPPG